MRFEPPAAECLIFAFKEGLLSAVAHDLEIRVTRFSVDIGEAGASLDARFDASSLRVVTALDGGRPHDALSDHDRRTIEDSTIDDVLDARRHPEIRFTATHVAGAGAARRVTGTLRLHGRAREVAFDAVKSERDGSWRAEVRIHQPDFGVKPYSAMFGTLKIKPDILVKVTLPAAAG